MFFIDSIALQIFTVVLNYLKVVERTKLKNGRFINKGTACPGFRNSCFLSKRNSMFNVISGDTIFTRLSGMLKLERN